MKTPMQWPDIVAGARVYSKGDAREGVVLVRKVRLGTVRWDNGTEESVYLSTLGVVGDADHARTLAQAAPPK